MKRPLQIIGWSFLAYILSWILFFVFINNATGRWSYWAYSLWVIWKFLLPGVVMLGVLVSLLLDRKLPESLRTLWVIWGGVTTIVVAWISYDSWRLYLVQDDAPMGIIPDFNGFLCLVIAGILAFVAFLGSCLLRWLRKARDQVQ